MTVAELSGRLSSRELTEWQAFYALEPWGTDIEMLGHAITASTVYNVNRGKRNKALGPKDFMPEWHKERVIQSEEQMLSFVETLNASLGGMDLRNRDE